MVPVVAEGRGESLRPDHSNRPRSDRGSDLFFWNLEATENREAPPRSRARACGLVSDGAAKH